MNIHKAILLAACLTGPGIASAAAPAAPSDLRVKPLGTNAFRMEWTDNSNNETGWEIRVSLGKTSAPKYFARVSRPDITSYVVLTNDVHGKELSFQIAAYNGPAGLEKISKPSSAVTVTAFSTSTFAPPAKLVAKPINDGLVRLSWKDKSTSEGGYQVQFRKGSGKWKILGTANPDVKFSLPVGTFDMDTDYSFRVRAFKQNPPVFTPYSNIATARTKPFQGPSDLIATAENDGAVSLKWKDRSSHEDGFEAEYRRGAEAFSKFNLNIGPNVTATTPITGFPFNSNYQMRIRAFRLVDGARVYSDYSGVASVTTLPLPSPTDLAASALNDSSVKLTWKHDSQREFGFEIQYRETGATDYQTAGGVGANVNQFTATDLAAHQSYQFRIRAYDLSSYSGFSPVAQAQTKDGFTGGFNPPILVGTRFLYPIRTTLPGSLTGLTVTGLPAGLVYNPDARTITGTLATGGNYTATLTATFSDGTTSVRTLRLRSISPDPVSTSAFQTVSVPVSTQKTVSVTGKFSDPDTVSATRVTTNMGNFDIILFPDATPDTVNNFIKYMNAGLYDNSLFHRSMAGFVVQAGGYNHTAAAGYSRTPTYPPVPNEPGLSNIRGTVAMAKRDNLPNSATSQFFVNMANNTVEPALLDTQNGGFTVFGRVPASGMALLDQINALPVATYGLPVPGGPDMLSDFPVNAAQAPATLDPSKLVKITSVDAAPILTYQVLSQNTAVATAALDGTNVVITGIAAGSTSITVTATDLDGRTVSQSIPVTVP